MLIYIIISLVIALWIWYPTLTGDFQEDDLKTWEWVVAFILTTILWPWFAMDFIIKLFK